jgi:outer membrane protein assembly factor BamE (lipoprotein component of BamABCDE complex)
MDEYGDSVVKQLLRMSLTAAGLAVLASGCAPVVDQRGYIPDPEKVESVRPGIDNKLSVSSRLGSPSSVSTFDQNVWYYISSEEAKFAFFRPRTTKREIVAVVFDENDLVDGVKYFGLEDGQDVNIVGRETPTRGKELSFFEQIFGNIGRFDSSTLGGDEGK